MKTIYSDDHNLHSGLMDPRGEAWTESAECPARADNVARAIRESGFGEIVAPRAFTEDDYLRVHAADYVEFLKNAWDEWTAAGEKSANARPDTFVGAGMRYIYTRSIYGKLGRYAFDATTPLVEGSWRAIRTSANVALTAAGLIVDGERLAFAACRPPGHHAARNFCGGYCYLNNNSLAAQSLLDGGASRIAILDVDYHHGNGTQSIFYERDDVLTVSLHADPRLEYPYFIGHADERGEDEGEGFNHNYPLPFGTDWARYNDTLSHALGQIRRYSPDALVVALGLDTFVDDPTTHFALAGDDFTRMGAAIAALGLPALVVLEGGYAVEHIGANTVKFLGGLESP